MFVQLLLGSSLMLFSILVAGVSFWVMEVFLIRWRGWLSREPHRPKVMLILCLASVWILGQLTAGVWMWALTLWALEILADFETAVYFSLVAFTTLGFGDILLPEQWRLLGGMAAANGLLNFGLLTAVLVEALRQVRVTQLDALRGPR